MLILMKNVMMAITLTMMAAYPIAQLNLPIAVIPLLLAQVCVLGMNVVMVRCLSQRKNAMTLIQMYKMVVVTLA
jgi:hypothetical protein